MIFRKNKKGIAEILQDIVGFFGIMVLFVIFIVIFSVLGETNQFTLEGEEIRFDTSSTFYNILQTNVNYKSQNMDFLSYLVYARSAGGQEKTKAQAKCTEILDRISEKTGLYGKITVMPIEENEKLLPAGFAQGANNFECKFSGAAMQRGFRDTSAYQYAISNNKGTSAEEIIVPGLINGSSYKVHIFFVRGAK